MSINLTNFPGYKSIPKESFITAGIVDEAALGCLDTVAVPVLAPSSRVILGFFIHS